MAGSWISVCRTRRFESHLEKVFLDDVGPGGIPEDAANPPEGERPVGGA